MKSFLQKFTTLRAKIITMLIVIGSVPLFISGASSYITSMDVLERKLETTSNQTTHEVARGIDNYFAAMSNIIKILSYDKNVVEADDETHFEFAKSLIANMKKTDDSIISIYVGTEKGMFYADPKTDLPADYNHKTRDWYIDAINHPGEIIITDPYIDLDTKRYVISIVASVQKMNNTIGVVGMDIDLATYSSSLSDITIGDSGYIYITDSIGRMIAHPDQTLIGTDEATKLSTWKDISTSSEGFSAYMFKGVKKFASYSTSELTGWKIVASMNYSELSKDTSAIKNTIITIFLITLIVAVAAAILFSAPMSRNIKKLLAAFDRLAHGDLTVNISIRSKDEFNLLGQHFNEMATNLSGLIKEVSGVSSTVLDTSVTLANMADETNSSLSEVARAVEEVAKGATEQAQNASDGASSISDLSDKLTEIDDSTEVMNQLAKNATDLTKQGLNRVENLKEKSDNTMIATTKVSELVYETSESMKQIEAISNTIDAITAQTNLLALNASIEAARAGESGKGFAVVADEIRKLAEQSKASTVRINSIVEEISDKTILSVDAMRITNQNVEEQVDLVQQTQSLFNEIMEAVHILTDKVIEIKQNTDEIADKKDNIVSQIENISAISEESASATEEVTVSTEQISITMDEITHQTVELQNLSEQLKEKINSFVF
jgi:methyl-accepting chemotaxis protein